jgi:enediyne biosynthesis protein E3
MSTNSLWKRIKARALTVSTDEVRLERRQIQPKHPAAKEQLENVGLAFLEGYHCALMDRGASRLVQSLEQVPSRHRGFAYEGAAMATWLLDATSIFAKFRWDQFYSLASASQPYIVHVGVGWAMARLPWAKRNPEAYLHRFDPMLGWLVLDGLGFHEGYFHTATWIRDPSRRTRYSPYGNRVFDQGLGRSLWFVDGTDVDRIAASVRSFEVDRREDLWSGVGLACAYAGQCTTRELLSLMDHADAFLPSLRQGISFGAEARVLAGLADANTERTCQTVCGMSAEQTAQWTRTTRTEVKHSIESNPLPRYELWRSRLRECLDPSRAEKVLS